MVLVEFLMCPPTPFAKRPNSFADDMPTSFFSWGALKSSDNLIISQNRCP